MTYKTYKQKYEELLIKQHKKKYIHFNLNKIKLLFYFLGCLTLSITNFFFMISIGNTYNVWEFITGIKIINRYFSFLQFIIIYPIIIEYILISLIIIFLVGFIKGDLKKVKKYNEFGIISSLTFCLITGLVLGLILSWIFSLIVPLIYSFIAGLIIGILGGLQSEFEEMW